MRLGVERLEASARARASPVGDGVAAAVGALRARSSRPARGRLARADRASNRPARRQRMLRCEIAIVAASGRSRGAALARAGPEGRTESTSRRTIHTVNSGAQVRGSPMGVVHAERMARRLRLCLGVACSSCRSVAIGRSYPWSWLAVPCIRCGMAAAELSRTTTSCRFDGRWSTPGASPRRDRRWPAILRVGGRSFYTRDWSRRPPARRLRHVPADPLPTRSAPAVRRARRPGQASLRGADARPGPGRCPLDAQGSRLHRR